MKSLNAAAASLLLVVVPVAVQADDMSYSYVDLDWTDVNPDQGPSGDGPTVRGSVGFGGHYFAFAEYGTFDLDVVDVDLLTVGLGGHFGLTEKLDFVGRAGYLELDISLPGFSDDQDGWLVSAGLRGRVTERVELEGSVMQRELGDAGDDTVFSFGGRYHFTDLFAIGAEYQTGNDVDFVFAGIRFSF